MFPILLYESNPQQMTREERRRAVHFSWCCHALPERPAKPGLFFGSRPCEGVRGAVLSKCLNIFGVDTC
jgi:hypothetical protein